MEQKFGRLTLVRQTTLHGRPAWECLCDCGAMTVVQAKRLLRADGRGTKSCGCAGNWKARKLPLREYAVQRLLGRYKRGASKRTLFWNLSDSSFDLLLERNCFYCGTSPSTKLIRKGETFLYSGIDRLNSRLGYTTDNTVPCCATCNRMKSDMSYGEFILHIQKIKEQTKWATTTTS